MVIAVVDGAAVTALSEGWNVKSTAAGLLTDLITLAHGMPSFQVPGASTRSLAPGEQSSVAAQSRSSAY